MTAADSLAIAEAVQKRLAKEEAMHGREHVTIIADSIAAIATRVAIDSILRANLPRGAAVPVFPDFAPFTAFGGKRRVVVTEPKEGKNQSLNAFGSAIADSLRRALMKRRRFSVVDPDSVEAVMAVSRVRSDVEKALKPDLLISPTFVGYGDSMTVLVTIRDIRKGLPNGVRVTSAKFAVASSEASIPSLVQGVISQAEELIRTPTIVRMKPNVPPPGTGRR